MKDKQISNSEDQPEPIWLHPPDLSDRAKSVMIDALEDGWIAPNGPYSRSFKKLLSTFTEQPIALVSSATAGLHLALETLGVGEGDFILTPDLSFIASANPIRYVGATPVFVDSEPESWNMCPHATRLAIQTLQAEGITPAAIILVHLFGVPAEIDAFLEISREFNIPLIEDAAESFWARYHDKPVGTFGDLGIYSFNGNKLLALSGGGAVTSNDDKIIDSVHHLANQAKDENPHHHYHHSKIGFNYQMSDLFAALGVGEWETLPEKLNVKKEINQGYKDALQNRGFVFQKIPKHADSSYWLSACLLPDNCSMNDRDDLINHLRTEQIDARAMWKPMHLQPVNANFRLIAPDANTQPIWERGICLPSGPGLSVAEQNRVLAEVVGFLDLLEIKKDRETT